MVPTPNTRANSLAASGLIAASISGIRSRPRSNPWDRAVALQQLAHLDDAASDSEIAARFGEAFAWRSGRALERRLEALSLLEESGAFTEPLYRAIFQNVGAVTRDPTVMLLHAPGWDFFVGGVQRTLSSGRALGEGRAARSHWSAEAGAGLMEASLDHAQAVVVFLTRELLADPRFVRELMLSVARVSKKTDSTALIPRLQVVLFDDLPDLRNLDRPAWRAAFDELSRELGDPAIGRLGAALRSLPMVAAAGAPPGEVARSILRSLGR